MTSGPARTRDLTAEDWPAIPRIYAEGIATGNAGFDVDPPGWSHFGKSRIGTGRLCIEDGQGRILDWSASSSTSARPVYRETPRGHRVLHLVGKGNKPATMPLTVPVLRVLEACRGHRTEGPLVLRPLSGKPIDRRDCYRMVARIARAAAIPRHISPHSLRHAAITNALDAGVPLRGRPNPRPARRPAHHRALRPRPRQPRPSPPGEH